MSKSLKDGLKENLRDNLVAGLLFSVPFGLTLFFLLYVWNALRGPLSYIFNIFVSAKQVEESAFLQNLQSLFGLMILACVIFIVGLATRSIIGRMALASIEKTMTRLPGIGGLYTSIRQLREAFISADGKSKFERAVLVNFPHKGVWAIGFVTGDCTAIKSVLNLTGTLPPGGEMLTRKTVTVFVPTTPLPTAGFLIVVAEEETIALNMPVQDALKMVVSGGILAPPEKSA